MRKADLLSAAAGAAGGGGGGITVAMNHLDEKMANGTTRTSDTVAPTVGALLVLTVVSAANSSGWVIGAFNSLGGTWTAVHLSAIDANGWYHGLYVNSTFGASGEFTVNSGAGWCGFSLEEAIGDIDMADPFIQMKEDVSNVSADYTITFDDPAVSTGFFHCTPTGTVTPGTGMVELVENADFGTMETAYTSPAALSVMPMSSSSGGAAYIAGYEFNPA
jgi:hypothetical protein